MQVQLQLYFTAVFLNKNNAKFKQANW